MKSDGNNLKQYSEEEIIQKYMDAGDILSKAREEGKKRVKKGEKLLDVADAVEQTIVDLGGQPAFPCNISRNDEAAHATPSIDDDSVFDDDMVKLDMGVHLDGYIADSAVTVDLSGNNDLVKASEDALDSAIDVIKSGVNTAEIGRVIEDAITGYGFKPVVNLTGHGLERYIAHASPSIPNRHVDQGIVLNEGDIIAIEPFATDGAGKIGNGPWAEIYSLIAKKSVRLPAARKLMKEVEKYRTLPFAKRWLQSSTKSLDFALLQLEKAGAIRSYPVLKEIEGGLVSQAEHTVMVTENGCEITTK